MRSSLLSTRRPPSCRAPRTLGGYGQPSTVGRSAVFQRPFCRRGRRQTTTAVARRSCVYASCICTMRSGRRCATVKRRAGSSDTDHDPVPPISFARSPVGGEIRRVPRSSRAGPSDRSTAGAGRRSRDRRCRRLSRHGRDSHVDRNLHVELEPFQNTQLTPGASSTALLAGRLSQVVSSSRFFSTKRAG